MQQLFESTCEDLASMPPSDGVACHLQGSFDELSVSPNDNDRLMTRLCDRSKTLRAQARFEPEGYARERLKDLAQLFEEAAASILLLRSYSEQIS